MLLKHSSLLLLCATTMIDIVRGQDNPESYFAGADNETYVEWLRDVNYTKSTFLSNPRDETKGAALHWTIDGEKIRLAVAAKAKGWSGFGIAEAGSMRGADVILFSAESKELVDSYVLDDLVKPFPDTCQSWELLNYTVDDQFIIFEAIRALDTGDTQDHALINDKESFLPPTRVIAAWGDTSEPSAHGPNFALGAVRFFADGEVDSFKSFESFVAGEAEDSFDFTAKDYAIPEDETTYVDFCLSTDDLVTQGVPMDQDLHVIGVEALLDPRTRPYVHHFIVFGTSIPWNSTQSCSEDFELGDMLYLWAPGTVPFEPPSNVGVPLGGLSGYTTLKIEVHYNNPEGVSGLIDNSGVRAYYTSQRREFDMGVLAVGDPSVDAYPRVLSKKGGLTQHAFTCPSDCTTNYFPQPVTVFLEVLHMHENGKSAKNEHMRDGAVIRSGRGQYYDFKAQGGLAVSQAPFEILPSDSFRTVCTFDAEPGEQWGLASSDEMCIAYMFYYPRQTIPIEDESGAVVAEFQPLCGVGFDEFLPGCGVDYKIARNFNRVEQIDRDFGTENGICGIGGGSSSAGSSTIATFLASLLSFSALLTLVQL